MQVTNLITSTLKLPINGYIYLIGIIKSLYMILTCIMSLSRHSKYLSVPAKILTPNIRSRIDYLTQRDTIILFAIYVDKHDKKSNLIGRL